MKMLPATLLTLALCSCSRVEHRWEMMYVPTTDSERAAVTRTVEMILTATPRSLSGNDQDWDDAIREAQQIAERTHCRPTMWEYEAYYDALGGLYDRRATGRWRYADTLSTEVTR